MSRGRAAADRARALAGTRAGFVDVSVAVALSVGALFSLVPASSGFLTFLAVVCALGGTTAVAWRRRNPLLAAIVAAAGLAGYARLTHDHDMEVGPFAVLLTFYTAGTRGITRRHLAQLAALLVYGLLACVAVAAAIGELTVADIAVHGLVITVVPAAAGVMVARQRSLTQRLAVANEQLRREQELRLAAVAAQERNRVARELHDVVAHGVSVMVVQAGAARITVRDEPPMARAALREVATSGRAALTELRRIMGVLGQGEDDAVVPPFGIGGLTALVEGRRAGGLPAQVSVTGAIPELPASTDLTLYRLVQEALTNVVKHASSAPTQIRVAFEPGEVDVRVTNAPPPPGVTERRPARSGHGLIGMRERVEACGGALWYGSSPDGGYEVHARLPLARPRPRRGPGPGPGPGPGQTRSQVRGGTAQIREGVPGAGEGMSRAGKAMSRAAAWLRRPSTASTVTTGTLTAVVLAVLVADAVISGDRRGSLALNVGLTAAMSLLLWWRRRAPLLFLVAVNLLALPLSNGLTSINNPTLVSTYVFVVPLWTVAVWSTTGTAITGLALTAGLFAAEGAYWHLGAGSVVTNVVVATALWVVGRIIRSQRAMIGDLERTSARLEAEQEARELLALAGERTHLVRDLDSSVAEQVSGMIVLAEATYGMAGADPEAAISSIARIEAAGRAALGQMRQILGLLRAEHDPAELRPLLGIEHIHDLVGRSGAAGGLVDLTVTGSPGPLLGGIDVTAYRLVADVLSCASRRTAGHVTIGLHFRDDALELAVVSEEGFPDWPDVMTREQIMRCDGQISRSVLAAGEKITVALPRHLPAAVR
jgi:signal transduction histidine kinase